LLLVALLFIALMVGRVIAGALHQVSLMLGRKADESDDLTQVNRLRRAETILILGMALIRAFFIIVGLYIWWTLTHPQQITALIGASAIFLLLMTNIISPIFRDIALGGGMMAEKWFGVGDLVTLQPFEIQGIVERVTLRSTRIKRLSGETVWVSNQNIAMVEVVPKGVHPIAIELFVSDVDKAARLIEKTNLLIPQGTSLVVSPIAVMQSIKNGPGVWHLTALAEVAPWREELITVKAVNILKDLDTKSGSRVLLSEPIARFADNQTEREFARAINNARKTKARKKFTTAKKVRRATTSRVQHVTGRA
jgi:hypothetical protein